MTQAPPPPTHRRVAVVSGDVVWDNNFYRGERQRSRDQARRGFVACRTEGGARLLHAVIGATLKDLGWTVQCAVPAPGDDTQVAAALWTPFPRTKGNKGAQVWRVADRLGYGGHEDRDAPITPQPVEPASLLVLDDAGSTFRIAHSRPLWALPAGASPWILLKMSGPAARGDLWYEVSDDARRNRLVCVVLAQDLRSEAVSLRHGASWEQTVEEVHAALTQHPVLVKLHKCRHLVVVFPGDGALWLENSCDTSKATLVFDPEGFDGDFWERHEGEVIGSMTTMAAALARTLASHVDAGGTGDLNLKPGIKAGLAAIRSLLHDGHGDVAAPMPTGLPLDVVMAAVRTPKKEFASARIAWPRDRRLREGWTIIHGLEVAEGIEAPLGTVGLAQTLAIYGKKVLPHVPHARFGDLLTLDRREIEALRTIERMMRRYDDVQLQTKPLSIGVFGPPGAGKSFGVKELAKKLSGKEAWAEFNLSQFKDERDLRGAFHTVRDLALRGPTPVVFWDEFDADSYRWLSHLLAPMQDGRFQDGDLNHAVGKAIFVFAGGTSERFAEFGPHPKDASGQTDFRLKKGPDFVSRLDAYYDVGGSNQRRLRAANMDDPPQPDPDDAGYPIRRALVLRHHLGCKPDAVLDFDSDLLDALLLVPEYRHGSRSLEKLVQSLRLAEGQTTVRRSGLPAPERIRMHVDEPAFHRILTRLDTFRTSKSIKAIARAKHAHWLGKSQSVTPQMNKDFDALTEADKQNNRAAARRVPEVLALAGLTIVPIETSPSVLSREVVAAQVELHLERLARAEHRGWVSQRESESWVYAPERCDEKRRNNTLVDYDDLEDRFKDNDRRVVNALWDDLEKEGYGIVWLGPDCGGTPAPSAAASPEPHASVAVPPKAAPLL